MMRNDFMSEYQKVMKESLNVFLNEQDCTLEENMSFGILDMDTDNQIKILSEYL